MNHPGADQRPPPLTGNISAPTGPERPGLTGSTGFRVGLLVASTAVLIGVALLAAHSGPWVSRTPGPPSSAPDFTLPTLPTAARITVTPQAAPAPAPATAANLTPWLIGLAVLLGVVLLGMLAFWWRQRDRRPARSEPEELPAEPPELSQPDEPANPLAFDARAAADQIITSWEGVERTAEWAGRHRLSYQTPTEFLTAATAGLAVDPQTPGVLLRLYHLARFDVHALGPDSARAAYDSAAVLVAGLRRGREPLVTTPPAGPGPHAPPGAR